MQILSRGLGDSLYTSVQGSIYDLMSLLSAFTSLFYYSALTLHNDEFKPKLPSYQPSRVAKTLLLILVIEDIVNTMKVEIIDGYLPDGICYLLVSVTYWYLLPAGICYLLVPVTCWYLLPAGICYLLVSVT